MAAIVTVYLEKGGSRKTTTTVHLAHALAAHGVRVLVIDVDGQRHSSRWLAKPGITPALTLLDVMRNPECLPQAISPTRLANVDYIEGSRVLPMVADSVLRTTEDGTMRDSTSVLRMALEHLPSSYAIVLIDCSPSLSQLNSNALAAADHVLCPLDMSDMSFQGLKDVATTLVQMLKARVITRVPPVSVLLATASKSSKTTTTIKRRITGAGDQTTRPYHVFSTSIRERDQMRGIFDLALDAFDLSASGEFKWKHLKAIAEDYTAVAAELARLVAPTARQKAAG